MSIDEPADATPRVVAGRYELGPVLGVGSSAVVRRARDLRSGLAVAFKHFHPGGSVHDRRQQRQEIDALARLDHPGLVGLHDGGTEDGRQFVVTDLVEGPTLAERLLGGPPMEPGAVRRLGAQLAAALSHVHDAGYVHRDVKPANVLLDDGARPRLADFGIARAVDATAATATGCVVGTAAYLAPEQARGQRVGPPTDIYALGLVLLECLTGRREYPGLAIESATARLHRPPVVPDGLPAGLGPLLRAMTADDPAARPTAAAVAEALSAPPAPAADPEPAPLLGGRHHQRGGRRPIAALLVGAVLVLVAVIGGVVLMSGMASPIEAPPTSASLAPAEPGSDPGRLAPRPDPAPAPVEETPQVAELVVAEVPTGAEVSTADPAAGAASVAGRSDDAGEPQSTGTGTEVTGTDGTAAGRGERIGGDQGDRGDGNGTAEEAQEKAGADEKAEADEKDREKAEEKAEKKADDEAEGDGKGEDG